MQAPGKYVNLRDEAVHELMLLCIWQSPMGNTLAMITPSVGADEARNSFVARGTDTKVLGHAVQLEMKVLQAVHDLGLCMVSERSCC